MTGATWLAWRSNRQAAVAGGALAAAAAAALVGVAIWESTQPEGSVHTLMDGFRALLIAAPGVAGVFVGAPLLSGDVERGTHRLIWTQGITRRRWAASSLALLIMASALAAAVMAIGGQIWIARLPSNFDTTWGLYDLQAPVVFAYVLFAVALGAAVGAALRRTLPAMAVTLAIFIAVRVAFVELARPHLLPMVTRVVVSGDQNQSVVAPGAGYVDRTFLNAQLQPLGIGACGSPGCVPGPAAGIPYAALGPNTPFRVVYQPASHFWPMQGIEAGIFILLAAALILAALRFATRDG
jgi:hypothetical protein